MRMQSALCGIAVCVITLTSCRTAARLDARVTQPTRIRVVDLVDVVSKAIQDTRATLRANPALLPLDSVTLTLGTVKTRSEDGGFDYLVIDATHTLEGSRTETITIALTPSDVETATPVSGSEAMHEYDDLKASILEVAKVAGEVGKAGGVLDLKSVSTEISFTVSKTNEGTLGLAIELLDLSAERSVVNEAVHTITLSFAQKKKS